MQSLTIQFPNTDILTRANEKADKLGISIVEYVSKLIIKDTKLYKDPWGPVPKHVAKRWKNEIEEFDKEEEKSPRPRFSSGKELVEYLKTV